MMWANQYKVIKKPKNNKRKITKDSSTRVIYWLGGKIESISATS